MRTRGQGRSSWRTTRRKGGDMETTEKKADELPPNFRAVESSNLKAVAFETPQGTDGVEDGACSVGTLRVMFKTGAVWRYDSVPREKALAMLKAPSIGGFFNAAIKNKAEHPATKEQTAPKAEAK